MYQIYSKTSYSHKAARHVLDTAYTEDEARGKITKLKAEHPATLIHYEKIDVGFWKEYGWIVKLGMAFSGALGLISFILVWGRP